jgi:hypothetical protein
VISLDVAIWVAAIFNLLQWSYLYKETRFFRFSEHTFLGLSIANVLVLAIVNIVNMAINPLMKGQVVYILPIVLGISIWTIVWTKYAWVSRYAIGLMIGAVTGLSIRGYLKANIADQLSAVITLAKPTSDPFQNFNNALMIIFTIATIVYFFFTTGSRIPPPLARMRSTIERIARYVMMAAFGTVIGGDIFARTAMMTARVIFILKQWLGL